MKQGNQQMEPIVRAVGEYAAAHTMWQPGARLVVAVSGGPDSITLLHILHRLAPSQALDLHVLHVDHGLRPDAGADASWVAQTARSWGLPCTVIAGNVQPLVPIYGGIEAAARALRYAAMRDLALELNATAVMTAHTADDQAETVLMRLLRGSGLTGLAGIRPRLEFEQWQRIGAGAEEATLTGATMLVRPMLQVSRAMVEAYCEAHTLEPRYDSSNSSPQYLRNRVRGHIIPQLKAYNSHIIATIGRTARICAEEDAFLAELAEAQWHRVAKVGGRYITIEQSAFLALHAALRRRLLRRSMAEIAPHAALGADHLDRMMKRSHAQRGREQLPGGVWMRVSRGAIILECTAGY